MYEYRAYVTKVYDGDTITCDIDLGFGVLLQKQKLRLFGLNTPEVRGPSKKEGIKIRDIVRSRILKTWITIKTVRDKKGKYGRWLAVVCEDGIEETLNDWLLKEGHAKEYLKK